MVNTADTAAGPEELHEEPDVLTPERLDRENQHHDRILAWLLVGLAFLLASFPVTDPDIWMHLRTGQMIVQGEFPWGQDPYAYTVDKPWVHAGWLSDVILWLTYDRLGGPGLVLLRGLLMAAVAFLLLRLQRPNGNGLAAVVCLGLALVAMGPRLYLRPELFSVLMLAATLAILAAPPLVNPTGWQASLVRPMHGRWYLLLVPLFALWANLDAWFLLGPVTVALWLAGAWLQERLGGIPQGQDWPFSAERRALALAGIAALLACLVNPWHIKVFQLPSDLASPALHFFEEHKTDLRLELILRPWQSPWATGPAGYFANLTGLSAPHYAGLSPAEWCYYPLAILGAVVFLLQLWRGNRHWSLLWLGFFLLSVYQARNVIFFAVVAGPFLTLALQDYLLRRSSGLPSIRRRAVLVGQAARFVTLLVLVTLVAFACWPFPAPMPTRTGAEVVRGWVHPLGTVGWSILREPSLEQAMTQLHTWRKQGQLPGHGFYLDWYEQPAYQVFFNPGGRHFLDRRFGQYDVATAAEFLDAFSALRTSRPFGLAYAERMREGKFGFFRALTQAQDEMFARQTRWQAIFRKHGISYLVLAQRRVPQLAFVDNRWQTIRVGLHELLQKEVDSRASTQRPVWQMLRYIDGQTYILGWNGGTQGRTLEPLKYDADAAVFQQQVPPQERAAWAKEPLKLEPESFREAILGGNLGAASVDREAAVWHLQRAEGILSGLTPRSQEYPLMLLMTLLDNLLDTGGDLTGQRPWLPGPSLSAHLLPYGVPPSGTEAVLAVRACRRGLAEANQRSLAGQQQRGQLYFLLSEAYRQVQNAERMATGLPQPNELREYQFYFALQQAAVLLPENFFLQEQLTREYARRGLLDRTMARYDVHLAERRRQPPPQARQADGTMRPLNDKELESWALQLEQQLQASLQVDAVRLRQRLDEQKQVYAEFALQAKDDPLERAAYALQLNLVDQAIKDLQAADALAKAKRMTASLTREDIRKLTMLEVDISSRLGDLPKLMHLMPRYRQLLHAGDLEGHDLPFFVYAAAGAYDLFEEYRAELDQIIKNLAAQRLIAGGQLQSLGGAVGLGNLSVLRDITGSQFTSQTVTLEGSGLNEQRARVFINSGLVALEAGQPDQAATHFRKAVRDLNPGSVLRPLAGHYYLLITGRLLDE